MPVPYVALQGHGRAPVLGALDGARVARCATEGLCQVCAGRLSMPYVILARESDAADHYSPDPAVHPECAVYAMKVCPMLNGQQTRYVTTAARVERAGWPGHTPGQPRPIVPWVAVWLDTWYTVTLDGQGRVSGLRWGKPLRVRPVPRGVAA